MSVCTANDPESDTHASRTTLQGPDLVPHDTTYRHAIAQVRANIKRAVSGHVYIYSFNIPYEELELAYALLDKQTERRSMKITYDETYNFIIRYMPSGPHEAASSTWTALMSSTLVLIAPGHQFPPGCAFMGATTYQLGQRKKQPDACVWPTASPSSFPSVVLEVGSSESISQLRTDMNLWIEDCHELQLGILLSIDPPRPPLPNFPRIRIELWRGLYLVDGQGLLAHPPRTDHHRTRVGLPVWKAEWTAGASPLYILLSDIFRGQIPAAYNSAQVYLDTTRWRQCILDGYRHM